ncbi:hypothetical protein GGX14DRAFT_566436 [Mycena pura]|uniref:Uncharacterized protein n=1 Tax=Mycena pura TaxID=153505 RepID=A0AAD6YB22_9AGAR|nr:hypothetical protein GGX14DRAFT_566436 [Mycena pura]
MPYCSYGLTTYVVLKRWWLRLRSPCAWPAGECERAQREGIESSSETAMERARRNGAVEAYDDPNNGRGHSPSNTNTTSEPIGDDPTPFWRPMSCVPWEDVHLPLGLEGGIHISQLCEVEVPLALNTAIEELDNINFTLSFACAVAVPQICEIINNPQGCYVVVEYDEDHVGAPGGLDVDVRWLERRRLVSSGIDSGLWATLAEPIRLLAVKCAAERLSGSWERALTIATAFWICLCIQDLLDEDWDLGGSTYRELQTGGLMEDAQLTLTRRAIAEIMMLSTTTGTPQDVARQLHWIQPGVVVFFCRSIAHGGLISGRPRQYFQVELRYQGRPVLGPPDLPLSDDHIPQKQVRFDLPSTPVQADDASEKLFPPAGYNNRPLPPPGPNESLQRAKRSKPAKHTGSHSSGTAESGTLPVHTRSRSRSAASESRPKKVDMQDDRIVAQGRG